MSFNLLFIVLNMKGELEYTSIIQHPGWVGGVYNIVYGCCNIQIIMHSADNLPSRLLFYQILQIIPRVANMITYETFWEFKPVLRGHLWEKKKGPYKTDTDDKRFTWYEMFYDRTRKRWNFNTGYCLIEVTGCADLTVFVIKKWVTNRPHELTKLHPTYWKCITLL